MKVKLINLIEGSVERKAVKFQCPGCKSIHLLPIGGSHPCWEFNGNPDNPTLSPSILSRSGHYIPGHTGECWCDYNKKHPDDPAPETFLCGICHSFVTDGKIQFLADSTHSLAGQTVELPDIEE